MTIEEWLRHAVEELDTTVFSNDLDLLNHNFQICWGKCTGKRLAETFQPYTDEYADFNDFFPTTIMVSFYIKDSKEMLTNLAYECIKAFITGSNGTGTKKFAKAAEKYYFEKPYKECHPNFMLQDMINSVYNKLVKQYGEFPGTAVVKHIPKPRDGKKNIFDANCENCGYSIKIPKKILKKFNGAVPTCICGAKMIVDMPDEEETKDKN